MIPLPLLITLTIMHRLNDRVERVVCGVISARRALAIASIRISPEPSIIKLLPG